MRRAQALFPGARHDAYAAAMPRRALLVLVAVLAGCGGDEPAPPAGGSPEAASPAGDEPAPRVAVPDGGMPAGHDNEPRRVTVPRRDDSAPSAVLRLASAEAVSGGAPPEPVRLERPVLEPVAVGRDKQGMARIRVSLEARLRCGDDVVPLIRYFPPPQIGPAWLPPGRIVPVERSRRVRFGLQCPSGELTAAEGTLWADATSARETEASSAPIRFTYRP
jgi:hypothetical protein